MTTFNVMDYGAIGDGITDDSAAFQATINAAESLSLGILGTPSARVYAPLGYNFALASGISISKPLHVDIKSLLIYTANSGSAVTIGTAGGQNQYGIYNFKGIYQLNGNTKTPNSVNNSGTIGLQINHLQFSEVKVEIIQGFTKNGIYLNGLGNLGFQQIIQHNRLTFGQVVNNGIGILALSLNAATSSVEANRFDIQNIYQNFCCIQFDDPTHNATTSNTLFINAMDNSKGAAFGGHGFLNYGGYNHIEIGYTGTDYYAGPEHSNYNSVRIYNTKTTDARICPRPSDNSNYYQIGGV